MIKELKLEDYDTKMLEEKIQTLKIEKENKNEEIAYILRDDQITVLYIVIFIFFILTKYLTCKVFNLEF